MFFFVLLLSLLLLPSQTLKCEQEGKVMNWVNLCIQPQYIEGCSIYYSQTQCHQCSPEFEKKGGKCFSEGGRKPETIFGCLEEEDKVCVNCANGFYRVAGKCKEGVQNCQDYKKDGTCRQCNVNYSLIFGSCKHNILLGCKAVKEDHTCKECYEPFESVGNHCDIEDCQTLNDYGCVACECGSYLTEERKCKNVERGCMRYQRGKCVNCFPHFELKKNGVCEIDGCKQYEGEYCSKCGELFTLKNGVCSIEHCIQYVGDKCSGCESNFAVSETGVCVQKPALQCQQ